MMMKFETILLYTYKFKYYISEQLTHQKPDSTINVHQIKSIYLWLRIKNNHLILCDFSGIETAEGQVEAIPEKGAK